MDELEVRWHQSLVEIPEAQWEALLPGAETGGAPAAVMNAINDTLAPFKAQVLSQPFTPEKVLKALGKV